jgi:uncharacterized protein
MSKGDLPDSDNLEEIFANIRKTLADPEPGQGLSKLEVEKPAPAAGAKSSASGAAAKPNGSQRPDRLSDALNGARDGHADEELTDLLATDTAAEASPKADATSRDPLWFLSRNPAGENGAGAKQQEEPRAEDIKLTRPETLRRSFPPLFGGGETPQSRPLDVPVERVKPADPANARALRQDLSFSGKPLSEPAKEPPAATPVKFEPVKPEPKTVTAAEPAVASEVRAVAVEPTVAAKAEPIAAKVETVAEVTSKPAAVEPKRTERDTPAADVTDVGTSDETEAKAGNTDAAGQQGQPLQEVIGRLLEPVIQQWLDTNLPRMVEAAIREEVSRQVKPGGNSKT